ncbi:MULTISPECIES: hypothetical protein [unclassified Pseudomonas]|jgi:hypothetical protein|uniref:hypothetical protein n=1 Tax=unclassified Pseudomonas TaxID=196821 RepID=UPI0008CDDF4A|nr:MULTISPECIES: hypothetical protein [unclassified Pseudomonas]PMV24891.1 hypothetical protein C1X17_07935 [Pseudomonas sp. FW305-3-2-15-C-TSA2]PMV28595.1 hypothetical protein C1X22_13140 [Pseudomonas sp. DP16D-L5]PMV38114.1 hypothetical protein C1X21_16590 [Pseudomonas sp. FW305-3-2-15-A-LB2]PMV48798.1 hypothetical protein C1X16_03185 [Pseudomonas sp. FW305-3-2-15-C-R2A1]PMV53585.1 hypothetical protein C1X18_06760 [Pseudomonas sp. FW305-3-2-15-C-LB1]
MSVTAVDSNLAPGGASPEARFNAAVDNAKAADKPAEPTDAELTDSFITQAVTYGGQFIIMPKMQELLNDAMSDDDEE